MAATSNLRLDDGIVSVEDDERSAGVGQDGSGEERYQVRSSIVMARELMQHFKFRPSDVKTPKWAIISRTRYKFLTLHKHFK